MTMQNTEELKEAAEQTTEQAQAAQDQPEGTEPPASAEEAAQEAPKTFDEAYVKALRKESAGYREKAKRADELAARLHTALVQADGRLQDPSDLPFDPAHLDTPEAVTEAIEALLQSKPHLASRRPSGTIPQGATPENGDGFSLAGLLRRNAA